MTQSSSLRFYSNGFTNSRDKEPLTPPTIQNPDSLKNQPDNVQGWLMNVHTYRDPENITSDKGGGAIIVDADNNSIPTENTRKSRNGRPGSIASEDSVNLDELINANFTADMDDETDLPDLAALDLDDSNEDFWKLDTSNDTLNSFDAGFDEFLHKSVADNYELDWSPSNDVAKSSVKTTVKTSLPVTPSSEFASRYKQRSDSISSENSLTSQSTITQYAKYGLTPMIYPSESSSTSSRSLSRLSNYSTASSNNTSGIPHPRTTSTSNLNTTGGIPTPSRSYTTKNKGTPGSPPRTKLAKRASHIPAPAQSPPSPQRTISSSSASNSHSSHRIPSSTTAKRIPQRASHIPTVRESIHRPNSPLHNHTNSGRASATPSRIGMRSPTPGPRNSLFNTTSNTTTNNTTTTSSITTSTTTKTAMSKRSITPTINKTSTEEKRVTSPTTSRPSGLRPPGSVASSVRSISRIGTVKKT